MTTEIYKRYRPHTFDQVVGQEHIVKPLFNLIYHDKMPHAILLHGPKGTGKTTLARILRRQLKCSTYDFKEQNCANKRGIDSIREIEQTMSLAPMKGKIKMWIFDEAHQWTGESQDALLKILEDTPKHVYFVLCTTDPHKLKATIRSRCMEFPVKPLDGESLKILIDRVCKAEKKKLSDAIVDKIISNSDGSARNALILLEKVLILDTEEEQLDTISRATTEVAAIEIARTLMRPNTKWLEMARILKATELEDPEGMRRMILGYAKAILINGGGDMANRAFEVIQEFRDHYFDCGHAGLVASCWQVIMGK